MTDKQQIADTASALFTSKTTQISGYTTTSAGGAGIISAISKLDVVAQVLLFVAVFSLSITIFSFAMNWYYKHQQHKREAEQHKQKIKLMVEGKWHGQE